MKSSLSLLPVFVLFINMFSAGAQTADTSLVMSLEQAQAYALQHNPEVINANTDLKIAKKVIWQTTAIGLPHISGTVDYQNMPDIPVQYVPDFISGAVIGVNTSIFGLTPQVEYNPADNLMPLQFGSKHTLKWNVQLTQLIFSGEYIVGLQASRTFYALSEKNLEKKQTEIKKAIAETYYQTLVFEETAQLVDSSLINMKKMLTDLDAMHQQGLIEDLDVDQMQLNITNVENSLMSVKMLHQLNLNLLKLQLGLSQTDTIILTQKLDDFMALEQAQALMLEDLNLNNNTDYKLLSTQEAVQSLSVKREKSKLLPQLAGFATYGRTAQGDDLEFDTWNPTSVLGLSLSIPIFNSGQQYAVIQEEALKLDQVRTSKRQLSEALYVELFTARYNLSNSINQYQAQKKNIALAEKIYKKNQLKYKEGLASVSDLTIAQNQYFDGLTNYYNALMQVLKNKLSLEKTIGTL